ncbi:MAG TPA: hypothetical protein VI756_18860 [Blastocatellia bacterium]
MKKSTRNSAVLVQTAIVIVAVFIATVPVATAATGGSGQDSPAQISREFSAVPGQQISLDLQTGAGLTITGTDASVVSVTATLGGRDGAKCRVDMNQTAAGIEVKSVYMGPGGGYSTNIEVDVQVPRQFSVTIRSAGGGIKLDNLEGSINGTSGGGAIKINNSKGSVSLSTGGGAILVRDCELDGTVTTGGGTVKIQNNRGNLTGSTGGGTVEYTN